MRGHRKLLIFTVLVLVIAAVGVVVYQRIAQPARAVMLLPDGDLLFYLNFSPAHFFNVGPVPAESDPEYQDFVRNTGFHFEQDLNTLAVSLRNLSEPDPEASAVFVGHFDQERLGAYLRGRASETEQYSDKTIFSIAQGNHLVRACVLDPSTVAITNMQSPDTMHSIIDKSLDANLIHGGPSLMTDYYHYVPFGSLAWVIFRAPAGSSADTEILNKMDFLNNTVSILSVRYTGSIRLRVEIISDNEANAKQVTEAANSFVAVSRTFKPSGTDKDVNAAFDSIQVEHEGTRTILSAVIPQNFVQKMTALMNH